MVLDISLVMFEFSECRELALEAQIQKGASVSKIDIWLILIKVLSKTNERTFISMYPA